jgi:hypothetical protein
MKSLNGSLLLALNSALTFAENDINFDLLTSLDHEVLLAIGVKSAGHRIDDTKSCGCPE